MGDAGWPVLGLDFGTTNSAVAIVGPDGQPILATYADGAERTATFRSILYVDPEAPGESGLPPRVSAGPAAIHAYLETGGRGRLIQSVKSHLASRRFTATSLFGVQYRLEDMIALLLRPLRLAAREQLGAAVDGPVTVGRPVRFAGAHAPEDDAFACDRLRHAVEQAGFGPVTFELEPLAAAHRYRQRLDHDELVLIGDFGGGTSDFSLVRLGPSTSDILGVEGVARAGDAFDARLIRHVAAPGLGLGSLRRTPFGRELPMPTWIYEDVERWDRLSFLKTRETQETLRTLEHEALEPEKIAALRHLVEDDLGFHLHGAVERTKRALSVAAEADFAFRDPPVELAAHVARAAMEEWIAPELEAIAACVDCVLAAGGVAARDVDVVFLTGGSAFVPAVRAIFAERFGAERLRGGEELTTVATGLALRAARREG
jgi:hypothetical chaperone protein